MRSFQGSESQGFGGAGFSRLSGRKRQRQWNRQATDAIHEGDPVQLLARLRTAHIHHRQQNRGRFQFSSKLARDKARQEATNAATTAYQDALRMDDPKRRACEAALRAYLEICPNDADVSDQVVKAIILAIARNSGRQ